ncbi:MAG: outer membrane beta-barrel family protein [Muribaculaceae bacterium]|nr:outer membrane beta-barrel family protein [Muribaculaceae bacterium]
MRQDRESITVWMLAGKSVSLIKGIMWVCAVAVASILSTTDAGARTLKVGVFAAEGDSLKAVEAVVSVYALPDTVLVDAALTDLDGFVSFDVADMASCRVISQSLVYGDIEDVVKEGQDSVRLCYEDRYEELAEFVVKAKKPYLTREAGKFIFDPSIYWSLSVDGVSLLQKTPLVSLENDKVSVFGCGESKIYINGRDPKMSSDQVMVKLRSLRPEYIKKIELITDVGSSENSSYGGGIVNVIVDDPSQGFSGMASASLQYASDYLSPKISVIGSQSKGGFNSTLMIEYGNGGSNVKSEQEYYFKQSGVKDRIDSKNRNRSNSLDARYDLDFLLGKTRLGAYVGIESSGAEAKSDITESVAEVITSAYAGDSMNKSFIHRENPFRINVWRGGAYSTTPIGSNGSSLDISADVKNYSTLQNYDYQMIDKIFSESAGQDVFSVDIKADYKMVFRDFSTLMFGYEYYYSDARYNADEDVRESRFGVRDHLHSCFASYRKTWNTIVSTEVGIRFEEYLRYAEGAERYTWFNALPSASVNFNIPAGSQSISLGYNRRTNFPHFIYLNPVVVWNSPVSCSFGNPYLDPGIADQIRLYYSFLKNFTFTASYSYLKGGHQEVKWFEDETAISTYVNRGNADFLYLGLDYTRPLGNYIRMTLTGSVSRSNNNLSINGSSLDNRTWHPDVSTSWMFFISPQYQWYANLMASVSPPSKNVTRYDSEWQIRTVLQIQKGIGEWGSLTLVVSPWSSNTDQYYDSDEYYYRTKLIKSHQYVSLSFNAMFGKSRVKGARQKRNAMLESR